MSCLTRTVAGEEAAMDGAGRIRNLVGRCVAVHGALLALLVTATAAHGQGVLENPTPGSAKSGIGVLSGWKCSAASATSITLTIDDLPPIQAAYGTGRDDTAGVCGDANNGFGVLFNFGLLSEGEHEIVASDAGVEFARATFTTSRFGASFLPAARGVTFIRDFPVQGQGAFMVWEKASQSFMIGGRCGSEGAVVCPGTYSLSAWTYADQETAAGPYTSPTNSANAVSQANAITRSAPGVYAVTLGGMALDPADQLSGVVHVTARQGNANFCVVQGWNPQNSNRIVDVLCYDAAGVPADTRFDVVFTRPAAGNEIRAFLWMDAPEADFSSPDISYQYNAAGPLATVERLAVGTYRAFLPALSTDGDVGFMLSAYGALPRRCRVLDVGVQESGVFAVDVACEDAAGAPADSLFTLSVIRDTALAAMPYDVLGAYLRTLDPETGEVAPDEGYNEAGGVNSVSRTATGRYVARLGGFAPFEAVGNVQVTAVGEGASHCTVEGMAVAGQNVEVVVLCFDGAAPANSEFALTYTR